VTETIRGISAGIAIDLAKRGANVVVNYTSPRGAIAGEEVVKEIEDAGSKVALVQANVALLSGLRKLLEAALTLSASRKIDILVHNAATGDDYYMENMTEEYYESQTDVNLKGWESFGIF
jgi:NAD(P)-dependent dehydrogenase (short-subunit alcohol dehydrogenase family)